MRRAAWLLPSLLEGSGGHRTILQNAQYLCDMGFACDIYVEDDGTFKNEQEAKKKAFEFFGNTSCHFYLGYDVKGDYDILFATAWYTAKIVRDLPINAKKAYFIQDFEALFNQMGDGYLMACNSYCYGLHPITIGRWLSNMMQKEYDTPSQYFEFCYDDNVYKDLGVTKENAICYIYQPEKPRRCHMLGTEALGIVKHLRPEIKIYFYGSKVKGNIWFDHDNLELISIESCNELYNKCKVGLCLSSSNPSRIPFEMMATGLPVVDLYMDNNLYDMPEGGVLLAHYTPESIADAIIRIYDDEQLQRFMSNSGKVFMKEKKLNYGFNQFYLAVNNILDNPDQGYQNIEKIYNSDAIKAAVISSHSQNTMKMQSIKNKARFIDKLKQNRFIRRSKLIRRIWRFIKSL